jgi:hypothetical protein
MTEMLSLNQLSRKLDVPYQSILALVRTGQLIPDSISGRYFLFAATRLYEIEKFLNARRRRATEDIT